MITRIEFLDFFQLRIWFIFWFDFIIKNTDFSIGINYFFWLWNWLYYFLLLIKEIQFFSRRILWFIFVNEFILSFFLNIIINLLIVVLNDFSILILFRIKSISFGIIRVRDWFFFRWWINIIIKIIFIKIWNLFSHFMLFEKFISINFRHKLMRIGILFEKSFGFLFVHILESLSHWFSSTTLILR